ncbi:hypothetical protein ABWK22_01730 [Gottfriedia acidiceleris]|uniref:hypothetical protein n=1 Tax=Gottfriedia acidiceleris TaxID=371036 RepID=UPI003398E067
MIERMEAAYARNMLIYQSYAKTHNYINSISENPKDVLSPCHVELWEEMSFASFVPAVVDRLCAATCVDFPDKKFQNCINNIDDNMMDKFTVEVGGLFHFGLLVDHLHLFSETEQLLWKHRMEDLFSDFGDMCENYYDFYDTHFRTNFFGGDSPYFQQFKERMKYTFVITCDHEWHTLREFGPGHMGVFADFAREYHIFYKELIEEVSKRRGLIAC